MAPPAWHVISDEITQSTELKTSGTGLIDMYTIPYVIDSGPATGHTGSVKVAVTNALPDYADEPAHPASKPADHRDIGFPLASWASGARA